MKLLDCPNQGIQATTDSEGELVRFDVDYLVECLRLLRSRLYSSVEQPDITDRSRPRPDYLLRDETGDLIAIEHARFFESEEKREREAVGVKKKGRYIGFSSSPAPKELGERLSEFFDDKLSKGQLSGYGDCERILLARNRWGAVSVERFLECEPHFKPLARENCDHFYLIVQYRLIEVF